MAGIYNDLRNRALPVFSESRGQNNIKLSFSANRTANYRGPNYRGPNYRGQNKVKLTLTPSKFPVRRQGM
ncbi:MAG: hypothetical protein ACJASL_005201 [Paraglaciecola sp.]|jgi:hypothetical protein